MRLRARARAKDGGYGGYGGYASALRADGGTTRRFATRATAVSAVSRLHAAMRRACGHARRADLSSRAGGFAPLGLRLMATRAPHICVRAGCRATGATMGARCGARNSERAACAALQLYQLYQYIDVPLDCRAARRWYVPADGDALRSAVSAALRPRRQLPKLITAPLVRQERSAPLTRVLPRGMRQQASSSASRSA